jgi:hypothetical protein
MQVNFRQKIDIFTITYLQYIHGDKNVCASINVYESIQKPWLDARHGIVLTGDT